MAGPSDPAAEIVRIHRNDAPYPLRQVGRGGQGEHRPHGLPDQRHIVEVEFGEEPFDAGAHRRFFVRRAGHDLGIAHTR